MIIFITMVVSVPLFCQKNFPKNDIIKAGEIIVYGLDFSNSIIIHESEPHVTTIENDYYPMFNDLFFVNNFNELQTVIKVKLVSNTELTQKLNLKREKKYIISDQTVISKIVKDYETTEKEGVGLVFIVKSFDKPNKYVKLFPTFFDIASKQVLWTSEITGTGGGYGLNKFWGEKLFDAIDTFIDSAKKKFK
jgi:hypothetical protein